MVISACGGVSSKCAKVDGGNENSAAASKPQKLKALGGQNRSPLLRFAQAVPSSGWVRIYAVNTFGGCVVGNERERECRWSHDSRALAALLELAERFAALGSAESQAYMSPFNVEVAKESSPSR